MHIIRGYSDIEMMKYKIASDSNVIGGLAMLAHMLGYGWCNGTRKQGVGDDFEVLKAADTYVMKARYDASDPYAGGERASERLKITLSNFRITIDTGALGYGPPRIQPLEPLTITSVTAVNASSDSHDSVTTTFTYQLQQLLTHTTNFSFTEGLSISIKNTAQIPFFGSTELTTQFSFSATQGWSNSTQTLTGSTDTKSYTGSMPARSKRLITLIASRTRSEIDYTAHARIDFDIAFDGFLRWSGNALTTHPTDRPSRRSTFAGLNGIVDSYDHRGIRGYSDWDWQWVETNYGDFLPGCLAWIRDGIGTQITGTFANVKGVDVTITAGAAQPLTATEAEQLLTDEARIRIAAGETGPPPFVATRFIEVDDTAPARVVRVR